VANSLHNYQCLRDGVEQRLDISIRKWLRLSQRVTVACGKPHDLYKD